MLRVPRFIWRTTRWTCAVTFKEDDMTLLETILQAGGGSAVQQIGSQLGLGQSQTTSALGALVPALAAGLQQNAQSEGGLDALVGALSSGRHQQYVENPTTLGDPSTIVDGNKILGHVLGSKDVSRQVASQAAAQTGLDVSVLKKMLPLAATLVMGALSNRGAAASAGPMPGAAGGSDLLSMLGSVMGSPQQNSSVLGMLGKILSR